MQKICKNIIVKIILINSLIISDISSVRSFFLVLCFRPVLRRKIHRKHPAKISNPTGYSLFARLEVLSSLGAGLSPPAELSLLLRK